MNAHSSDQIEQRGFSTIGVANKYNPFIPELTLVIDIQRIVTRGIMTRHRHESNEPPYVKVQAFELGTPQLRVLQEESFFTTVTVIAW